MVHIDIDLHERQRRAIALLAPGRVGNFIAGQFAAPRAGRYLPVVDPATGVQVCEAPDSQEDDVREAVAAAREAFERGPRADSLPADRERWLVELSRLIERQGDELSALETLQSGKLRDVALKVDVGGGANFVRYMAGWATKLEGQTLQPSIGFPPGVQYHAWTRREPLGVVAAIVPWNFPLAIALWKVAPALAAGCTVVLKPSPETPLTALRLAELAIEAGFPPGVLNVVCGGGAAGQALVQAPDVDKITFTGSTPTGRSIGHAAVDRMAHATLELGGKSPMIVLPDADVSGAAFGLAMGIFFNQGQVCTAGSRLYVHRSRFDEVVERMAKIAASLKLGSGFAADSQIGPLVSRRHCERVQGFVEQARQDGAQVAAGGQRVGASGCFMQPTVLTGTRAAMQVVREEVFGPVVAAMPYDEIDEVVALANDSEFGLAASLWSNDLARVHRLIPRLQAGTVWVNCHNMLDNALPLGGFKQSGLGKDLGRHSAESFTRLKSVCMAV